MALKELSKITKKVDKGGGTVLMNREDYIREPENQLKDNEVYKKLTHDPMVETKRVIDMILQEEVEQEIVTTKVQKMLVNDNPRVLILYLVPKVHKSLKQPIVSGIGSVFEPLAVYINSYLPNIVKTLPHCLKDTNDVTWMCTLDIKSLYTNIPLQEETVAILTEFKENAKL